MSFDSIDRNGNTLANFQTSSFPIGTLAFVATVGDYFSLQSDDVEADGITVVGAKDDPARRWLRMSAPSPLFAGQLEWAVDPTSGNDENVGDMKSPLATAGELGRRLWLADLTVSPTITILGDLQDNDLLSLNLATVQPSDEVQAIFINGVAEVMTTIVVGSSQLKNAAANQANEISVPGFDFAPHVGKIARLQGTTTDTAVITKSISLGNARLGERTIGNIPQVNGPGYTTGQTLEILKLPKVPGIVVSGMFQGPIWADSLRFDPQTGERFVWLWANPINTSGFVLRRSEVRGQVVFFNGAAQVEATSFVGNAIEDEGNLGFLSGCAFIDGTNLGLILSPLGDPSQAPLRSCVFQNYWVTVTEGAFPYVKADIGMFDLPTGTTGIALRAYAKLHIEGLYYGSGNDPGSTGISFAVGATASYTASAGKPVMDAGNGMKFGSGGTVPFSTLPVSFDPNLGTAFYAV